MTTNKVGCGGRAIGLRLKELRSERNMTIQKMATTAGVDPRHLKRIEEGQSELSILVLYRLMAGIDKRIEDFFDQDFEKVYAKLLDGEHEYEK